MCVGMMLRTGTRGSRRFGLALRMVLVSVLTPALAIGLLVTAVLVLPGRPAKWVVLVLVAGIVATLIRHAKSEPPPGTVVTEKEDPELAGVLDRLCGIADVPRPELVLSDQRQPNSWVVHAPGKAPRLYLTRGLRELLTLDELAAVLAHELAHVANRDALVMTVVGSPGTVMRNARGGWAAPVVWAIGWVSTLGTNMLSRYREFAADAGSAQITGRPSALAMALMKVSGSLEQFPKTDLREAAAMNSFNLVAIPRPEQLWQRSRLLSSMVATHPPLRARLDALHELERAQQSRRRP
jgi:heat shock protein HtpX